MIVRLLVTLTFLLLVGAFLALAPVAVPNALASAGLGGIFALLLLAGLAVACIASVLWLLFGGKSRGAQSGMASSEEARLMQELNHNLTRMEERVESLETILLDRERKGTYHV